MKKNTVLGNILAVAAIIVFAAFLILRNVATAQVPVAAEIGSFADSFAEKNNLPRHELADSEKKLFTLTYSTGAGDEIPFEYNITDGSVTLVKYTGAEDYLVVPSAIDEMPVTDVAFSMLGFSYVVLPPSLEAVSGELSAVSASPLFITQLVMTVLAALLVLVMINVILPKMKKSYFLTFPQLILSIAYLVVQTAFGIFCISFDWLDPIVSLAVSAAALVLYFALMLFAATGKDHAAEVEAVVAESTSRMKALRDFSANIAQDVADRELKKQVERLVEDIRYSDPVTKPGLTDIENRLFAGVAELKGLLKSGDAAVCSAKCAELDGLLKERNGLCISNK